MPKLKQISSEKLPDRLVKIPLLPAGITLPVNEKPKTVSPPVDTVNPASAARPPDAPLQFAPTTSN